MSEPVYSFGVMMLTRKQGLDKIGFHIDGMLILDAQ